MKMGRKRLKGRCESRTQVIRKGDNGERALSEEMGGSVRLMLESGK